MKKEIQGEDDDEKSVRKQEVKGREGREKWVVHDQVPGRHRTSLSSLFSLLLHLIPSCKDPYREITRKSKKSRLLREKDLKKTVREWSQVHPCVFFLYQVLQVDRCSWFCEKERENRTRKTITEPTEQSLFCDTLLLSCYIFFLVIPVLFLCVFCLLSDRILLGMRQTQITRPPSTALLLSWRKKPASLPSSLLWCLSREKGFFQTSKTLTHQWAYTSCLSSKIFACWCHVDKSFLRR